MWFDLFRSGRIAQLRSVTGENPMQCYNCSKHFDFLKVAEATMDVPHPTRTARGYRVMATTCPNCGQLHIVLQEGVAAFRDSSWFIQPQDDTVVLFPRLQKIQFDDLVPRDLVQRLSECYAILDISPTAAVLLARTLLQQVIRLYFGIRAKTLREEIDMLLGSSRLDEALQSALHHVRALGNIAAHPEDESIEIKPNEAHLLISVVDALIRTHIETPAKHNRILQDLEATLARYLQREPRPGL